jgi:hypothetical protein
MDILKNTYNLSKFLLSAEFKAEIYKSDLSYVLCKNGKAQYIIHNLEAFKRIPKRKKVALLQRGKSVTEQL